MKVLWLCNIVLPDFSGEFGLRKHHTGGWLTGMLHQLEDREDLDIAVCCPIIDPERAKDGLCGKHKYYSFPFFSSEYHNEVQERFQVIVKEYAPDVIHIWGTEYPHTLAMVNACEVLGLLNRVVINIQGLVSAYAGHYFADVPPEYWTMTVEGYPTIQWEYEDFVKRGRYEIEAIQKVRHVIGRTDWDEVCTTRLNPDIQYHFCNEILREEFYHHIGEWSYEACEKHSVFVSQAGYPIKGFHYLLKALPDVLRSYPDTHIYVGGSDIVQPGRTGNVRPYGQYVKFLIEESGLEKCMTFLGERNEKEMIEQYKRANVFVSPSSIENSSNSVQEAALIGCPIVASYVGGTANYVHPGKNGYLYQSNAEYMLGYYIKKVFAQRGFGCTDRGVYSIEHSPLDFQTLLQVYDILSEA